MPRYRFRINLVRGRPSPYIDVYYLTHGDGSLDYALVLIYADRNGNRHTVRVYDNAHGQNEMHRYTKREGKQNAEVFHPGTTRQAMAYAIAQMKTNFEEIIESWRH